MLRILRRSKSPLLALLFATYMGSSGCATGGQPEAQADEMEASQNEDLSEDDAALDAEGGGEDEEGLADDGEDLASEVPQTAPAQTQAAGTTEAPTMAVGAIVPSLTLGAQERGFVAGKAGNAIEQGLPEAGSKMAYIVQKGDTLSKIAKRVFSDLKRWRDLAVASSLKNPNLIYPGDVIYYQLDQTTLAFARKYENMQRDTTPVRHGENLSEVSKRIYGDRDLWKFLWRHNDQINDPDNLTAGSPVYYVNPGLLDRITNDDYSKVNRHEYSGIKKVHRHVKRLKA